MPDATPEAAATPAPSPPDMEMSAAMRGAFEQVVEDQALRREGPRMAAPSATPLGWMAAAAGCWLTLLLLVLWRPAIARTPEDRTFVAPLELRAPSLRFGLWLARRRVDGFEHATARLPRHVGEAGVEDRAIVLETNGRHAYTLIARDGSVGLRLTSEMSADSFLGQSVAVLMASRAYQQAGVPGLTTAR